MNDALVKKSKWFWAWNDDKEEQWLGEMSRQGLHLQQAAAFGQYTFEQGEPRECAYRLDFVTQANKKTDYYQLFRDAGWEHVGEMSGWQYWRKEIVDGKVPEIFTDNASKVQKYQRLIGLLILYYPIFIIFLSRYNDQIGDRYGTVVGGIYEIAFFLFFSIVMVNLFALMMILRRIMTLKRK
jgi:hypothetical protein